MSCRPAYIVNARPVRIILWDCDWSGRNKDTLKRHLCLSVELSDCWNDGPPKPLEISPENSILEKQKEPVREVTCLLERNFMLFQLYLPEIQRMMCLQWTGPHLDQDCLDVHILGPPFKLWSYLGTRKMKTDLRGLLDPFVPLPDVATLNTSTFHLTLLIDLLRTGRQAWLGAQVMTVKFDKKTLRGGGERENPSTIKIKHYWHRANIPFLYGYYELK